VLINIYIILFGIYVIYYNLAFIYIYIYLYIPTSYL